MWNMKALSLLVQSNSTYCQGLVFLKVCQKSRSRSQKFWYWQKGLATRNTHVKYENPISNIYIQRLWPRLSFFKSRSKVKFKVTKSKLLVSTERSCHKEYTCVTLSPISFCYKVMVKVKFTLNRQTDGQTDRVIPIYPPNSEGGIIIHHAWTI